MLHIYTIYIVSLCNILLSLLPKFPKSKCNGKLDAADLVEDSRLLSSRNQERSLLRHIRKVNVDIPLPHQTVYSIESVRSARAASHLPFIERDLSRHYYYYHKQSD